MELFVQVGCIDRGPARPLKHAPIFGGDPRAVDHDPDPVWSLTRQHIDRTATLEPSRCGRTSCSSVPSSGSLACKGLSTDRIHCSRSVVFPLLSADVGHGSPRTTAFDPPGGDRRRCLFDRIDRTSHLLASQLRGCRARSRKVEAQILDGILLFASTRASVNRVRGRRQLHNERHHQQRSRGHDRANAPSTWIGPVSHRRAIFRTLLALT